MSNMGGLSIGPPDDLLRRIREAQEKLVRCPACGEDVDEPHHRWNGNPLDSRLVCENNSRGVGPGEEFSQE